MSAKKILAAIVCLGILAPSSSARATPDFPPTVDQDLMLPAGWVETKVAPPDGCHLCHVNGSQGGEPLTAFGTLMQDDGAVPYEAASTAASALAAVEAANPRAITDIKDGTNPNSDPTALNDDPVPQYGCGSVAPHAPRGRAGAILLAVLGLAVRLVRRPRAAHARRPDRGMGPARQ